MEEWSVLEPALKSLAKASTQNKRMVSTTSGSSIFFNQVHTVSDLTTTEVAVMRIGQTILVVFDTH